MLLNEEKRDSPADGHRLRTLKTIAATFAVLGAVTVSGVVAFIYSGSIDVTATNPHWEITHRVLLEIREQSIKRQARDVKVPELDDPGKVHAGLRNFQEMCVICHGAPGIPKSQVHAGLYPQPPDLAKAAKDWTSAELYVITKHGIKMTGMPAWGPTHSDEELWSLVAFLKMFSTMPAAEYQGAAEYFERSGSTMQAHGSTH